MSFVFVASVYYPKSQSDLHYPIVRNSAWRQVLFMPSSQRLHMCGFTERLSARETGLPPTVALIMSSSLLHFYPPPPDSASRFARYMLHLASIPENTIFAASSRTRMSVLLLLLLLLPSCCCSCNCWWWCCCLGSRFNVIAFVVLVVIVGGRSPATENATALGFRARPGGIQEYKRRELPV